MRRVLPALLLALAGAASAAPQRVQVPSLDAPSGTAVALPAIWFPLAGDAAPAPALLLLHGCAGLYDGRGQPGERVREMAAQLNALGIHALATDSFTPRGEREICTQRVGQRHITMLERRRDVLGALQWLAAQPGVDASRIGVLGWSNGGSAVLAASNRRHAEVHQAAAQPALAIAFYPGCESELLRGYAPTGPLLMLLGELDDWTPAAPCKALALAAGAGVQWDAYEGAYHGFDGTAPVRLRRDVPGGANPGEGVHVGAEPAARAAAAARLAQFLRLHWKLAS
jgi:dienelactone hydrolase